ncbi:MBL fold metallo-hydrolase [bacterium]|nr:MBL fold metallo-hydrolase [bacterium]NCQ55862.1 MBL fold metallo-hydrolase [Candidatus Parcubacteria bacterium]NCS67570.1 MBL fold metallo-hydrolase [Candidatus Peregrinibacteria bacterium]NCS96265.1 MBL fold metallo-hydrolase [bacterium]
MKVYQVLEGRHDQVINKAGLKEFPQHTGSVTLIHASEGKVLIDTGSRAAWPEVKTNLANLGVLPDDVDYVFLTHLHLDHSFNVSHFTKARVFAWAHEWSQTVTKELVKDLNQSGLPEIIPHIMALKAPGHDECMNSFFVTNAETLTLYNKDVINLEGKKLCISGDALNQAVVDSEGKKLPYTYNDQLYRQSANALLSENPDYILPGHGPLISKPLKGWPDIA